MTTRLKGIQRLLVFAFALGLALPAPAARLKIVTSFVPVYSFTANVAGDLATVENLLPDNVDPHDFQLAPRDLVKLTEADIVVVNGLSLEGWLAKAIESAGEKHFPAIVKLSDGLAPDELIYDADEPWAHDTAFEPAHAKRLANPHIWLDPQLAEHAVTNICQALQKADPENAAGYARNATAYIARLQKLDDEIKLAAESFTHRDIVTDHNAFPYFARRYRLNLVGVVEEVDEVPPSPRYLTELEGTMRAKQIKVLFTSPPIPPREARQIASDLDIGVATLNTIEIGPLKPETYENEMRQNLRTLEKHLR